MELISTVKMKRAQDLALEKREFVLEMLKIFLRVEGYLEDFPLLDSLPTVSCSSSFSTSDLFLITIFGI